MPYSETFPDYLKPSLYKRTPQKFFGATLEFLRNPYEFISANCHRFNSDVFEARLFFRKTYFFTGQKATELFYTSDNFARAGAMPEAIKATLIGKKNGIQSLDGSAHLQRKKFFLDILSPDRTALLADLVATRLFQASVDWTKESTVKLYSSSQKVLTEAACLWLGIPLAPNEVETRSQQLMAMFEKAGAKGFGHLYARLQRKRSEWWIQDLIQETILDKKNIPDSSIFREMLFYKEDQKFLDIPTTANEVLNVLRPIVAVSVYWNFITHALALNPELRWYVSESPKNLENFVHEVRRYYPFFPMIAAKTVRSFTFEDTLVRKNRRALLDVHGTNHDPRIWDEPEKFKPERFDNNPILPYNFIPQGGGNPAFSHRCAGEMATIELMKVFTNFLTQKITYEMPRQDLTIDKSRLPALPKSRIILKDVKLI